MSEALGMIETKGYVAALAAQLAESGWEGESRFGA